MGQMQDRPETERGEEREDQIAQELKKHSDVEYVWGRWYCECGVKFRSSHTELAAHRDAVERKLRGDVSRG
ncbi:hypothetical protein [Arthrobacter sp. NPDC058192]|uniref:hypothetical protein n=1 Tax=Arthrobacter sp. NPDC058192 TaxID=3346372 RepID=UPI0036F04EAD